MSDDIVQLGKDIHAHMCKVDEDGIPVLTVFTNTPKGGTCVKKQKYKNIKSAEAWLKKHGFVRKEVTW